MSDYLEQTGKSFDFAAVKATLLNTAFNAGIMLGISAVVWFATKALDTFIYTVEEANQAMDDAMSEYESETSKLESINSELDTQSQKLDDLLAKDKLTYAEKGQLKELQEITKNCSILIFTVRPRQAFYMLSPAIPREYEIPTSPVCPCF